MREFIVLRQHGDWDRDGNRWEKVATLQANSPDDALQRCKLVGVSDTCAAFSPADLKRG